MFFDTNALTAEINATVPPADAVEAWNVVIASAATLDVAAADMLDGLVNSSTSEKRLAALETYTTTAADMAVGYDLAAPELALHSGPTPRRPITLANFERTWQRAGGFAAAVLPPDQLPAFDDPGRWLTAASGLERAGRTREAGTAYRTALARWPRAAPAWVALGNVALADFIRLTTEAAS